MPIDLHKLSFVNESNKQFARDLFGMQGFCILRNFLSPDELKLLRERYTNHKGYRQIGERPATSDQRPATSDQRPAYTSYHHFLAYYIFKNDSRSHDTEVLNILRRVYRARNEIALQPNSDRFMQEYCQRFKLDPENLDELFESQFGHSWARIALYRAGEGQVPHYDNPGELQAILPISEKGMDYHKGGLTLYDDDTNEALDIDSLVKAGDLIILNAYKKKHSVIPVECLAGQVGRLHIFMPIIPDYIFAGKYYYFTSSKLKLFFPLPVSRTEKVVSFVKHLIKLPLGKTRAIDEFIRY